MYNANDCVPPHCTDFTDMDLTGCVFLVLQALSVFYFVIIIIIIMYLHVMMK